MAGTQRARQQEYDLDHDWTERQDQAMSDFVDRESTPRRQGILSVFWIQLNVTEAHSVM